MPTLKPKLCQRACKTNPREKEILKNALPHDKMTMKNAVTNRPTNHDRQGSTGGNMGLASCGVTCLNSSSVFQINFGAGLTVLCPEIPHERQAQNRYGKGY
jgi:hypothetical protein